MKIACIIIRLRIAGSLITVMTSFTGLTSDVNAEEIGMIATDKKGIVNTKLDEINADVLDNLCP